MGGGHKISYTYIGGLFQRWMEKDWRAFAGVLKYFRYILEGLYKAR